MAVKIPLDVRITGQSDENRFINLYEVIFPLGTLHLDPYD